MILSFRDKETEKIWHQQYSKKFSRPLQRIALRKLFMLHRAKDIHDLCVLPGNHLERLQGKRKEQYSIRINNQFRICFQWEGGHAYYVEIIDYH